MFYMNRRLKLAVLAQAVLDIIDEPDVTEDELESAIQYLSHYPALLKRIERLREGHGKTWANRIDEALGRRGDDGVQGYYERRRD